MGFITRLYKSTVPALLLAVAFLSDHAPAEAGSRPARAGGKNGFVMVIQDRVMGKLVYYIRGNEGKMLSSTICFLVPANGSKIVLYSDQTHRILTCSPSQFKQKSGVLYSWRLNKTRTLFPISKWKREGNETLCGVKAVKMTRTWSNNKRPPLNESYKETLWAAPDLKIAPMVAQGFSNLLKADLSQGSPLKFTRTWQSGRFGHRQYLDYELKGFERKELTDEDFKVPTGYTPVKDEMGLLMDSEDMSPMQRSLMEKFQAHGNTETKP